MGETGIFRWIWRFNALGLALALIAFGLAMAPLVLFGMGFSTVSAVPPWSDTDQSHPAGPRVLTMNQTIEGTDIVIFSYGTRTDYRKGPSSSYSRDSISNFLFYNSKDGASRWLFPGNDQKIATISNVNDDGSAADLPPPRPPGLPAIPVPGASQSNRAVRALIFDVIPQSTANGKEVYQVFASRPDGTEVTKLVDGADEVAVFTPIDASTILVSYRRDGQSMAATFSLTDFKPVMEQNLSKLIAK